MKLEAKPTIEHKQLAARSLRPLKAKNTARVKTNSSASVFNTFSTSHEYTTAGVSEHASEDCNTGYASDDSESMEELSEIFGSKVVITDETPRNGAQSTFRDGVVRKFWTPNGMEIKLVPTPSYPHHFKPIEEEKHNRSMGLLKRKQT